VKRDDGHLGLARRRVKRSQTSLPIPFVLSSGFGSSASNDAANRRNPTSNRLGVPFESAEGEALGIELYELASFGAVFHRGMDSRLMAMQILLAGDPESVVSVVRSAATGTNDLVGTIIIRDEVRRLFALPANHSEIGHS
jgi:hypothetical protein